METTRLVIAIGLVLAAGCSKDDPDKGPRAYPDDPRPLGSCVGTAKNAAELPAGNPSSFCLEQQTKDECDRPSTRMTYAFDATQACAARGYTKQCPGDFPASTRFQDCPKS